MSKIDRSWMFSSEGFRFFGLTDLSKVEAVEREFSYSENYNPEDVNTISIESNCVDIHVKRSGTDFIEVSSSGIVLTDDRIKFSSNCKNGNLNIRADIGDSAVLKGKITIYVSIPSTEKIKEMRIITASSLVTIDKYVHTEKLDISSSEGSDYIINSYFGKLYARPEYGNISISVNAKNDIEIDACTKHGTVDIQLENIKKVYLSTFEEKVYAVQERLYGEYKAIIVLDEEHDEHTTLIKIH